MTGCPRCRKAAKLLKGWAQRQGHERCWYYPEVFRRLLVLLEVEGVVDPGLPPRAEFAAGCKRYQEEEYGAGA